MTDVGSTVEAAARLLATRGVRPPVDLAIVTGTGLGGFVSDMTGCVDVSYADVPGFFASTVSGHSGRLVLGDMQGSRVLALHGRSHLYEHGDAHAMRIPIALLAHLEVPIVMLTNASGSTRANLPPASIVAITDHINYSGVNPLIGEAGDDRFVSLTDAYDAELREQLHRAALLAGVAVHDGVYMWFSGPSFETPAEIRMARTLGADLVGMSTVPEVILARRYGLRVLAVSVVTNYAAGIGGSSPSHAETKATAAQASDRFGRVVKSFVGSFVGGIRP
jgi:purine-nucleoside phosphorylase